MRWFEQTGVHCVVDGQFGSTGKGALSAFLAQRAFDMGWGSTNFGGCIYSGGPNSGHTCYFGEEKIVLKQLPTFAVYAGKLGLRVPVYLSAGAIIDQEILKKEAALYPDLRIYVHPNAAMVTDEDRREEEQGSIAQVAGTRSGTGAALVRKIQRDPKAIARESLDRRGTNNVVLQEHALRPDKEAYFMEVSQGFSLGINSKFYPKVTSRECTVMQGLADARLPAKSLAKVYMAVRTYPIRVGNVGGFSSGGWYNDQDETSWAELGVKPELTTVTQRVRRVANFSMTQFFEACLANDPDVVFISHMDYLGREGQLALLSDLYRAKEDMGKKFMILTGFGPYVQDIWEDIRADHNSNNP